MTKQEFLRALWNKLSALPSEDVGRALDYFSEMIDDRMESGLTEEEAVAAIGSVDDAVAKIAVELPKRESVQSTAAPGPDSAAAPEDAYYRTDTASPNETSGYSSGSGSSSGTAYSSGAGHSYGYSNEAYSRKKSGGMTGGKVALLILTFPFWFPLLITCGALVFSFFVVVWSLVFALFVVGISFIACTLGGVIGALLFIIHGRIALALVYLGAGLILGGLGLLIFLFSKKIISGAARISGGLFRVLFSRKEADA